jgi:peptidoglycan/LPS O-acetylase OafA/YrhL
MAVGEEKGGKPRLDYIDGVRGVCAIYIVVHHLFLNLYPTIWHQEAKQAFLAAWWHLGAGWLLLGHYAVGAFIVLSGYCLMMPVSRDGALRGGWQGFYTRRLSRILPTYYAAIVFCALVDTFGHVGGHLRPVDFVVHALLINNWLSNDAINGAFWFIATQAQLYVLFPLLVWLRFRLGIAWATLALVAVSLSAFMIWHDVLPWSTCVHYVGLFALGMLVSEVVFSPEERWKPIKAHDAWGPLATAALLALTVISTVRFDDIMAWDRLVGCADLLVGVLTASLLVVAARSASTPLRKALEWKPLVAIGTFSYSLYLTHGPILILVRNHLPYALDNRVAAIMCLVVAPVCFVIGYVFYLLFEKPIGAARKKQPTPAPTKGEATPA